MDPLTLMLIEAAVKFALTESYDWWKARGGEPMSEDDVADLVARSQAHAATADDRLQAAVARMAKGK